MIDFTLPSKPKAIKEEKNLGIFEIEGLYPGYGLTLGNALRRVLLSSLPGAAVTTIKIKGVNHEFSTISGVAEDVIQIILSLKKIRVKVFSNEPQNLTLSAKGEGKVTAKDFGKNSSVEIINPEVYIATLTDKKAELEITITVENGLGFVPVEAIKKEKLPIGTISVDALFSPIKKINYEVEDMRVGEKTDFNRLRIYIETDGTVSPRFAMKRSAEILFNHFQIIEEGIELSKDDIVIPEDNDEEEKKEVKKEKKAEKTKTEKKSKKK